MHLSSFILTNYFAADFQRVTLPIYYHQTDGYIADHRNHLLCSLQTRRCIENYLSCYLSSKNSQFANRTGNIRCTGSSQIDNNLIVTKAVFSLYTRSPFLQCPAITHIHKGQSYIRREAIF
jgi:hypothetical protein